MYLLDEIHKALMTEHVSKKLMLVKNKLIPMKKTMTLLLIFLMHFCISCEKGSFNIDNPDVDTFVEQLKNGTYNQFEVGQDGEKLWTRMPKFRKEHIPRLINLAKDTSYISPCNHFPVNPVSSISTSRGFGEKPYIILGEYLLWCVEGIIHKGEFVSLTPMVFNTENEGELINGKVILELRRVYQKWWEEHGETEPLSKNPLEGTDYQWR